MPSKPFSIAKGAGGLAGVARKFIQATSSQFTSRNARALRELLRIPRNRINSLRHYYFEEILEWNHKNSILGWYPLAEDFESTVIKDFSGNEFDGWTVGTPTTGTANKIPGTSFAKAVRFNSTGHLQFEVAGTTGPLRLGGTDFTVFGWFKRAATSVGVNFPSAGLCTPLFVRGYEEGVNSWQQNMNYGLGYVEATQVFRASAEQYNGGVEDFPILGTGPDAFGTNWRFLCLTWKVSVPRQLTLYVDGSETGFYAASSEPNQLSVSPLAIGRAVSSTGVPIGQFYGWAQHCGILTKRLTAPEVMELYLAGATES